MTGWQWSLIVGGVALVVTAGLAIVKQLTELLGGTVRVTRTGGTGTTFTVNLPITLLLTSEGVNGN